MIGIGILMELDSLNFELRDTELWNSYYLVLCNLSRTMYTRFIGCKLELQDFYFCDFL